MARSLRTDRRTFLGTAAGITGAAIAATAIGQVAGGSVAAAAATKDTSASRFELELHGSSQGLMKSIEGGDIRAEVVAQAQADYYDKKHISTIKYDDFAIELGIGASAPTLQFLIEASWLGNFQRRDGAVNALDAQLKVLSRREFTDALISETTIPTLDGASKDAADLTVMLRPEQIAHKKPSGSKAGPTGTKGKTALLSNFKLGIVGLDCTKVSKIDSFGAKVRFLEGSTGETTSFTQTPTKIDYSDLRITFDQSTAATWRAWFDDFVVKGHNDDTKEKDGTLDILAVDGKKTLLRISFFRLGIYRLSEGSTGLTAHLYAEQMQIKFPETPGDLPPPVISF